MSVPNQVYILVCNIFVMLELLHMYANLIIPKICAKCYTEIYEVPHCFDNIDIDLVDHGTLLCSWCWHLEGELIRTYNDYEEYEVSR